MERLEANIGNTNQTLYCGIWLYNIYYLEFVNSPDENDMVLPYVQEMKDQKI